MWSQLLLWLDWDCITFISSPETPYSHNIPHRMPWEHCHKPSSGLQNTCRLESQPTMTPLAILQEWISGSLYHSQDWNQTVAPASKVWQLVYIESLPTPWRTLPLGRWEVRSHDSWNTFSSPLFEEIWEQPSQSATPQVLRQFSMQYCRDINHDSHIKAPRYTKKKSLSLALLIIANLSWWTPPLAQWLLWMGTISPQSSIDKQVQKMSDCTRFKMYN